MEPWLYGKCILMRLTINHPGDIYRFSFTSAPAKEYSINLTLDRIIKIISDIGAKVSVKSGAYQYILTAKRNTSIAVIKIDAGDEESNISFDILGERDLAWEISDILQEAFPKPKTGVLLWCRMDKRISGVQQDYC